MISRSCFSNGGGKVIVGTCPTFRKLFLAHFSKNYFCKTQRTVTRERSIDGKPRVSIREFEFAASGPRDRNFTRSWSELMTSPRFLRSCWRRAGSRRQSKWKFQVVRPSTALLVFTTGHIGMSSSRSICCGATSWLLKIRSESMPQDANLLALIEAHRCH